VLVCLIMGGMSGSGPADAAAVATVMLPSMMKAGYPRPFTASVIAASASTAILIPPSIALIVYSVMVPGLDLRALFAAGLVPGLLVGLAIAVPHAVAQPPARLRRRRGPERPALLAEPLAGAAGADGAGDHPGRAAQRACSRRPRRRWWRCSTGCSSAP
jgi:C4-dicarboxylate transporter, DctM subunit